jgi:hypothetical protein
MHYPANIVKSFRLLFTAITLLLVVGLNNREVAAFVSAPVNNTEQKVNKAAADQHGTVKQKISFEATHAGIVLPPAVLLTAFSQIIISPVFRLNLPAYFAGSQPIFFFRRLLSTAISPNAP